ncbi:MAG: hypothetical protein Ct9H300mP21_07040 [Pseudomonadota bacterium]|nr:MAG: hypothetical protein Ct9H300mP21_07040 [Pseudomonadota bacterium]
MQFAGTAKPIPTLPADPMIAVLIPITFPPESSKDLLSSGLIAASFELSLQFSFRFLLQWSPQGTDNSSRKVCEDQKDFPGPTLFWAHKNIV